MPEALESRPTAARPHCDYCGEPIGVFEPLWLEQDHGRVRLGSVVTLDRSERDRCMWHSGCLGRATVHVLQ
jgi:hypothetical protein